MATDPRELRGDAPLLDAWLRFQEQSPTPFTIPGHKQRHDLVGDVVAGDVPLYAGLDTMKVTAGVLADAEGRAARLWGADLCRFSVGGSTHANQSLALAVGKPGDQVIVGRTLHRSMLLGLVLAGLEPVWVTPHVHPEWGLPLGIAPDDLSRAFEQAPRAVAAFVTDPAYVGVVGDVAALAEIAHAHGAPLVVDAAWAPHFGFHDSLPRHALQQGADAMVVSAHKTLPAWSQAAMVLARTHRLDPQRIEAAVEATHTTSPAGAILASIDASRALLARDGAALLGALVANVGSLREQLRGIPGLVVPSGPLVDPTKVTLVLPGTGADGNAVEQRLLDQGMPVELADRDTIVAIVTMADDADRIARLGAALTRAIAAERSDPRTVSSTSIWDLTPVTRMSPRAAFFADREAVAIGDAVGRVSAELIAPYPPGIPVLAPGEEITVGAVAVLQQAQARGTRIAYAADPTLATLTVVATDEPGAA